MPTLRSALTDLASRFASDVLAAIRSASLDDLLAEQGVSARGGPGRSSRTKAAPVAARATTPQAKGGRLGRRSPADIEKTLAIVVSALKATRGKGLRSEQIQIALRLDKRELPRVLRTGIAKKAIRSKGQKRATVYFAA
jgi:hypothetical protein